MVVAIDHLSRVNDAFGFEAVPRASVTWAATSSQPAVCSV